LETSGLCNWSSLDMLRSRRPSMMPDSVLALVVPAVLSVLPGILSGLPDESVLRLNAAEQLVSQILLGVRGALWDGIRAFWKQRAEQVAGHCPTCGHPCECAERTIHVTVSGQSLPVSSVYYYCRSCHRGNSPLANWLGLHRGQASNLFERQLVAL